MFNTTRHTRTKSKPEGIKRDVYSYKKRTRLISTAVTCIIIFSLIALISYYLTSYFAGSNCPINENNGDLNDNLPRAALIDALYSTHPNQEFTESLNQTLRETGFELDVFQGTEVTVDFLKKMPNGYKLIILRMHSALGTNNQLYLFTGELYSIGKYTQEQYLELVKEAYATQDSQSVFAVNWGFIKRCMTKKFNGTLVIAMGCDGTLDSWIIEEFINQGAVGYVAWTGPVLMSHSDEATLHLIQALYTEKLQLEEAVEKTNDQVGEDPEWGVILKCYAP
jgi:hypothetical protein